MYNAIRTKQKESSTPTSKDGADLKLLRQTTVLKKKNRHPFYTLLYIIAYLILK